MPPAVIDFRWNSTADLASCLGSVLVRTRVSDGVSERSCALSLQVDNAPAGGCPGTCGDCDVDSAVTVLDALRAAQATAGPITLCGANIHCCDASGSGAVDILDALFMAQAAAGLPVSGSCP